MPLPSQSSIEYNPSAGCVRSSVRSPSPGYGPAKMTSAAAANISSNGGLSAKNAASLYSGRKRDSCNATAIAFDH